MKINDFMQLVSIVCRMASILFVTLKFSEMQYNFVNIIVRFLIFKDIKPIRWLESNIIYLWFLIFTVSQVITVFGLLHQMALNQVDSKPSEFFIASPLSSISFMFILQYYFTKESRFNRVFERFGNR